MKNHLRLDHSYDDNYLSHLIQTATDYVENYIGKTLLSKTFRLVGTPQIRSDSLSYLKLPNLPILEIISVKKLTGKGNQNIKRFCFDQTRSQPEICIYNDGTPIEVIYKAGFGDKPKHVPPAIYQSVLIMTAEMYEKRVATPMENSNLIQALLAPHRQIRMK